MHDGLMRPFKLSVRNRGEWIEAMFVVNEPGAEDSPDALIVSRLLTAMAYKDKELFEDWVRALSAFVKRTTQSITGQEVEKMETNRHFKPEGN